MRGFCKKTNVTVMRFFSWSLVLLLLLGTAPLIPAYAAGSSAYLGQDIKAYQLHGSLREYPENGTFKMADESYSYGLTREYTSNGTAYYRIYGQYTTLTGLYGPKDGCADSSCTITISDENSRILAELQTKMGDLPKTFSIDVTGVEQLVIKIDASGGFGGLGSYGLANALLSGGAQQQSYTINATASPGNGGTVTGGGSFIEGAAVTLQASPNSNWTFSGWYENGAIVSTNVTMSFTAAQNRSLEARFTQMPNNNTQFTITAYASPDNGIRVGGTVTGGGIYNSGSAVTLTAVPNSGWYFSAWYEGSTIVSTDSAYTFTAAQNRALWAAFIQTPDQNQQYTIAAVATPSNGGTVTGSGIYKAGDAFTITAVPNSGWTFVGWHVVGDREGEIFNTNKTFSSNAWGHWTYEARFEQNPEDDERYSSNVIATTDGFSFAIDSDEILWAWGGVNYGSPSRVINSIESQVPKKIMENAISVAADDFPGIVYVIKNDGSLWMCNYWESQEHLTKVADDIIDVTAAGSLQLYMLKSDGTLWHQSMDNRAAPVPTKLMEGVADVMSLASLQECHAIKSDGTLWSIKPYYNQPIIEQIHFDGLIADTAVYFSRRLIVTSDGDLWALGQGSDGAGNDLQQPIKLMTNVSSVEHGGELIYVIQNDGKLWSLEGLDSTPALILDEVANVSASEWYLRGADGNSNETELVGQALAVKNDGSLWAWGTNEYGEVGDGTSTKRLTPVMIWGPGRMSVPDNLVNTPDGEISSFQGEAISAGVKLRWNPNSGGVGYRVYRSDNPNDAGISITDFYITYNEFIDVNVKADTTYYYSVRQVIAEAKPFEGMPELLGPVTGKIQVTTTDTILGGNLPGTGTKNFILMTLDDPIMSVNGTKQEIDPGRGTIPLVLNSRTLVPIRAIVEEMGGTVGWNGSNNEISLNYGQYNVLMWLDSNTISVNGTMKEIDVAPTAMNNRTMVPIRFAVENLGCEVDWLNSTKQVVIVYH